jgi:hypothetical protein
MVVIILLPATIAVGWVSDLLVATIEPVALRLGLTQLFIGVVVVALVGDAAEHTWAIVVAAKKPDGFDPANLHRLSNSDRHVRRTKFGDHQCVLSEANELSL